MPTCGQSLNGLQIGDGVKSEALLSANHLGVLRDAEQRSRPVLCLIFLQRQELHQRELV